MEKTLGCDKHKQPVSMFCYKCNEMICGECVEGHTEQGHKLTGLFKFAETTVLPQLAERGEREDASGSLNSLSIAIKAAKERETAYVDKLKEFVDSLNAILLTDPAANVKALATRLAVAVKDKNLPAVARTVAVFLVGFRSGDEEQLELRSIMQKSEALTASWKAADAFCAELNEYVKKRKGLR